MQYNGNTKEITIQKLPSKVPVTEKNEKQYFRQIIQLDLKGPLGAFSDQGTTETDSFTNKPVVQCNV